MTALREREGEHVKASSNLAKKIFPQHFIIKTVKHFYKEAGSQNSWNARKAREVLYCYMPAEYYDLSWLVSLLFLIPHHGVHPTQQPEWHFTKCKLGYVASLLKLRNDEYSPISSSSLQTIPHNAIWKMAFQSDLSILAIFQWLHIDIQGLSRSSTSSTSTFQTTWPYQTTWNS